MSSAPGGLQEEMAASRPGQCGLPVWQSGRTVAGLVVMSADAMCTDWLRDHGIRTAESNGVILHAATCDAS